MKKATTVIVFAACALLIGATGAQEEGGGKPAGGETAAAPAAGEKGGEATEGAAAAEPPAAKAEEKKAAEPKPAEAKGSSAIEKIIGALKKLQEKLDQSEKRMDEIVGIVLSSVETKGSRVTIIHRNEMSADFRLIKATFSLDGAPIYKKSDDEGLLKDQELEIYDGAILPGKHVVSVMLVYRGHGYGLLSYLEKYKFKTQTAKEFEVKPGKGVQIKIVGYEKGDVNTKLEDRIAIKYVIKKTEAE